MSSSYEWWTINIAVQFRYRQFRSTFFLTARAFERGTPKRTKAAWPEKATSENATCDENVFQKSFLGENMNRIVPENVEMVCERATWKTWKGTKSHYPRGSTEIVLWLYAESSNSDLTLWYSKEESYSGYIVCWRHEAVVIRNMQMFRKRSFVTMLKGYNVKAEHDILSVSVKKWVKIKLAPLP